MSEGPRIDHYDWSDGREPMLRFGPDRGPVVVAALPLFEEANRTRACTVTLLRALARRGVASALPELPGTGESLVATRDATLPHLRRAYAAAVAQLAPAYAVAIRSAALLDTKADVLGRWHLSPQRGESLTRELGRIRQAHDKRPAVDPVEIGGNRVSAQFLSQLAAASPNDANAGVRLRTVRFDSDPRPADLKLPGAPLWRRSEPDNDPPLADRLAGDIVAWIATCGA